MKVYKMNAKLVVNVPAEVLKALDINEQDEVEFIKEGEQFIFTKKGGPAKAISVQGSYRIRPAPQAADITEAELKLLMKLDTLRYKDRTKEKVNALLTPEERKTLQSLDAKKFINLFKKEGAKEAVYGIAKNIYDKFLFGKRGQDAGQIIASAKTSTQPPAPQQPQRSAPFSTAPELSHQSYLNQLEAHGYVVLANEPEAASLSVQIEDSVKTGTVIGVRAFNKRYYVALRSFINQNAPKLLRQIEKKGMSAPDISVLTGINVDAVRAILYILAEQGDVSEIRKDVFRAV